MTRTRFVTVPVADIHALLVRLGFRYLVGEAGQQIFDHPATDSVIAIQKPRRGRVPAHYVSLVSKMLDERGFATRGEVERELLAHANDKPAAARRHRVTS